MQIKVVRHAPSEANEGIVDANLIGDHKVRITPEGHSASIALGYVMADFIQQALKYRSPYVRTRQTADAMMEGAARSPQWVSPKFPKFYEDPRLREVEWGLGVHEPDYWEKIERMKQEYGSFYIRRHNGESCADCYDRCAAFVGTMVRQINRKSAQKVLIVSHGLTIRCLVASFMHLSVEEFETLRNPHNLDVITITDEGEQGLWAEPQFTCGKWFVSGLRILS